MKFTTTTLIILSIINIITFINGNTVSDDRLFINIFPYLDDCDDVPVGIGYSFLANTCLNDIGNFLNLDREFNYQSWTFNITEILNSTQTYITAFKYLQHNCTEAYVEQIEFSIGEEICQTQIPMIAQFSGTTEGSEDETSSTITVTNEPVYPDNSQIYAIYENDKRDRTRKCDVDKFLYAVTISNNLIIDYLSPSNTTQTFTCTNGPSVEICDTTPSKPVCKNINIDQPCGTSDEYPTNYLLFTHCSN